MAKIENIIKRETVSYDDYFIENCLVSRNKNELLSSEIMDLSIGRFIVTGKKKYLRNKIIEYIDSAKNFVCLCSFILTETEIISSLKKASQRGVRVYILTAPEHQLTRENSEADIRQDEIKKHKEILGELTYTTLTRTAPHLHSKFLIVDPKSEDAKGILSTANFSERELTENPDIGVILSKSEIQDLFKQFIRAFWKESERELLEKGNLTAIGQSPYSADVLALPTDLLITMKDSYTLKEKILEILTQINPESDKLIISIYSIKDSYEITEKILDFVNQGGSVTLLTRARPINIPALIKLQKKGARVLIHDRVHGKVIIVKGKSTKSVLMTANLTELGLESGFETGLLLDEKDTAHLNQIIATWIGKFPLEFLSKSKLKDLPNKGYFFDEKDGKTSFTIHPETTNKLGKFIARSLELMNDKKPSHFPDVNVSGIYYRKCVYEWEVEPPTLPNSAKKDLESKEEFEIYRTKKNKYIVISDTKHLKKAEKLAKDFNAKIVLPNT